MSKNSNLHNAKRAKQDEFYTQWIDIEREMNAYLEYDPNVFRGKTVLLPCDEDTVTPFRRQPHYSVVSFKSTQPDTNNVSKSLEKSTV